MSELNNIESDPSAIKAIEYLLRKGYTLKDLKQAIKVIKSPKVALDCMRKNND